MMVPADVLERKFNPDHDPANGQFASGAGAGQNQDMALAKTTDDELNVAALDSSAKT